MQTRLAELEWNKLEVPVQTDHQREVASTVVDELYR